VNEDARNKARIFAKAQRERILKMESEAPIIPINLNDYDFVIVNSSGGKDSLAALWEIDRIAKMQDYPASKVVVSHQDLGESEWKGTKELAKEQADLFGYDFKVSKRRREGKYDDTLLEYAERRGKWPSNAQRWCTSDFKRGPGARVVTALTKGMAKSKVLYVFGFRADESPARKKKKIFEVNTETTTKTRTVHNFLPIHNWTEERVWKVIKGNKLPYHFAYDLGMPRLSCCFCIFAPFDALVIAGQNNPELLDKYVAAEKRMGHTFKAKESLADVKKAIGKGYEPKKNIAANWNM
jgi:3'-phosphoadenosine 5'-phosphosulfate sulfotransferase (PAPS reductase)/FAD synthetase